MQQEKSSTTKQVSSGLVQCPVCRKWLKLVKEGEAVVASYSCNHFIAANQIDDRLYGEFKNA